MENGSPADAIAGSVQIRIGVFDQHPRAPMTLSAGLGASAVVITNLDGSGGLDVAATNSAGSSLTLHDNFLQTAFGREGDADDLITRFTYTRRGQIDTITDPRGHVTDYDYDQFGRTVAVTFAKGTPDQAVRRYEYDPATIAGRAGYVTAVIDENQHRTEFEYDAMNRVTRVRQADPDGPAEQSSPVTQLFYDENGNLNRTIDPMQVETVYTYDAMDRVAVMESLGPTASHLPDPPTTRYTYALAGEVLSVVDPNGNTTEFRYDVRHRRTESIDPDGGVTRFEYDLDDNLTALIDPVGNRTEFSYDARNRLIAETDPLGKVIEYVYDAADNLVQKRDRNGRVTRYVYDDANRLLTEAWLDDSGAPIHEVSFGYDSASNLTSVSDALSQLAFGYDARDRLLSADNQGTPGAPRAVVDYRYDGVGNVLAVTDTLSAPFAGATTTYDYDALDRLIHLTQSGQGLADKRVEFRYNPLGQYTHLDRYADLAGTQLIASTAYDYDGLNRLLAIDYTGPANETLAFFHYQFDAASRITRIVDRDGATDYDYDRRDQLISAVHADLANPDERYEYDANGNRLFSHLHGTGYRTGPGNRLLTDGTYNYAYDDEGNTIRRTRITGTDADGSVLREFAWDYRNRLVSVTDRRADNSPTQVVRFTYDGLDRRITSAVDTTPLDAVDAAITHFVYDREDVILDFLDADGSGPGEPVLDQRYLHGPGIDQVLAQDDGQGEMQWMLTDHLGTVVRFTQN